MKQYLLKNILVTVVLLSGTIGSLVYLNQKVEQENAQRLSWVSSPVKTEHRQLKPAIRYTKADANNGNMLSDVQTSGAQVQTIAGAQATVAAPNMPMMSQQPTKSHSSHSETPVIKTSASNTSHFNAAASRHQMLQSTLVAVNSKCTLNQTIAALNSADVPSDQPFEEGRPDVIARPKVDIGGGGGLDEPFFEPVGEAWVMLGFVLIFALSIYIRNKKHTVK